MDIKNIFDELKRQRTINFKSEALAMLHLDDENFIRLYLDEGNEIVGDQEDVDLCNSRALHLKIIGNIN